METQIETTTSSQKATHKLIITEWLTLSAVFVGCFFFLHTEIQNMNCQLNLRIQSQEQRSDRLYEMFIDLIKEGRK